MNKVIFENFKTLQSTTVDSELEADIPKTFPELNPIFEQVHSLSENVREVLIAFTQLRPDIGYRQGMSHIAGLLLLHCTAPCDSFKLFTNVVMLETVYNFFTVDPVFIK